MEATRMVVKDFKKEMIDYWADRSITYAEQHRDELLGEQKKLWQDYIHQELLTSDIKVKKVLDIGTGPGFLSIILADLGYEVTSIDMTEEMLTKAKCNAGDLSSSIDWQLMDAQELLFDENEFDAIVTRNVTWNLENPEKAYQEWLRVLKPGGILLNFDSNWYHYLYDEKIRQEYNEARRLVKNYDVKDLYEMTDIQRMEELARRMPMSKIDRPQWDIDILETLNISDISIRHNLNHYLLSKEQQVNCIFSPIFLVKVTN